MEVRFVPVELSEIRGAVRRHLETLPRPIDSFLEEHVLRSAHYRIRIDGEAAGSAAIHGGSLITRFCLDEPCKRHGQAVFQRLRKLETVSAAFVPTCDEFFLSHALDDYRQLAKQAYFFTVGGDPAPELTRGYTLRPAELADVSGIRDAAGDFFPNAEQQVRAGELFLTHRDGERVGFGVLVRSRFYGDVASIGMFTIERFRATGVGTATIALLIAECARQGLRPVAGCWYYNHLSKRTLERAGMISQTRLLKIEY